MSELWGIPDKWAPSIDGSDQRRAALEMSAIGQQRALTAQSLMKTRIMGIQLAAQERYLGQLKDKTSQSIDSADGLMDQMLEAAHFEQAMGHPDKAAHIMSEMALRENQQRQTKVAEARLKEIQAEHDVKKRQDMYETFAGVENQDDYDKALMMIAAKYPDEQIPNELRTYNPQIVDYIKKTTKRGLEEAKLKAAEDRQDRMDDRTEARLASQEQRQREREAAAERRQAEREAAQDRRLAERERFQEGQQAAREAAADRRRKEAGEKTPVVGDPKDSMVKAADALLRRNHPHLAGDMALGKDMVSSAAYDIASEAKALMASNRGLSASEAMNQVYVRMRKAGAFQDVKEPGFFGTKIGEKSSTTYSPKPRTAAPAKSPEDAKAVEWAKAHPDDPRAKKIMDLQGAP